MLTRFGKRASDVLDILRAAPLVWIASEVTTGQTLTDVLRRLTSRRRLPRQIPAVRARCATIRACRVLRPFWTLDASCVVRSLVVGTLLSDHPNVYLHIGFHAGPRSEGSDRGHAWVTLDGVNVSDPDIADPKQHYIEAKRLPIRRSK
jgi:hypothetical protein